MTTKFDKLYQQIISEAKETNGNDSKIESKTKLKEYAMTLAKGAFGDKTDEDKVNGMVDNAIEKNTKDGKTDWGAAAGMITGSFNS